MGRFNYGITSSACHAQRAAAMHDGLVSGSHERYLIVRGLSGGYFCATIVGHDTERVMHRCRSLRVAG